MEENFRSGHQFGGELAKLNLFSRTLTDQEVADMYSSGICSTYEHSLTEDTFLSWDTLLGDETEKHGNIVKFNLTCPAHTHSVEPTTAQPTEQPEDSCQDRWGFLRSSDFENQEITIKTVQDMKHQLDLLAEFEGHQLDERLIAYLIKHLLYILRRM